MYQWQCYRWSAVHCLMDSHCYWNNESNAESAIGQGQVGSGAIHVPAEINDGWESYRLVSLLVEKGGNPTRIQGSWWMIVIWTCLQWTSLILILKDGSIMLLYKRRGTPKSMATIGAFLYCQLLLGRHWQKSYWIAWMNILIGLIYYQKVIADAARTEKQ